MGSDDGGDPVLTAEAGARRGRLSRLVAAAPVREDDETRDLATPAGRGAHAVRARLARVCAVAVTELGVDGAGVTVMSSVPAALSGHRSRLASSDGLSRRLDELQLTLGEGPCVDAFRDGVPVLAGDLAVEAGRWMWFAPGCVAAGVAAVFSLPLAVGAVRLGTLDLHRTAPGPLSRGQLADALVLAQMATEALLELAAGPAADPGSWRSAGWLPDVHGAVHVASGMVATRAGLDVGTALVRIRAYAFARGEPINDVARRIVDRSLMLDAPDDPDGGAPAHEVETDDS